MLDKLQADTLTDIMQSCPVGMLLLDENKRVSWMNDTLRNLLGSRASLLHDKQVEQVSEPYRGLFAEESTVHIPATESEDGLWLLCTSRSLGTTGQAQFLVDISATRALMQDRDQLRHELKELRAIDDETGLPNSKALFQSLEPQVSRSRRYQNPLSIIIMRLTNLETLQNKYPEHSSQILLAISQMLNDQMRWADIIGRLSDTDFLLVLPETHAEAASDIAEKIRERFEILDVPEVEVEASDIQVNFGVAEWQKGDDVGLLMMRAREMLGNTSSDAA
ncbi:MAG: diguanylate cyclase [Thioalkalispiraceae bacterium]|jgi:diguanylate cyclase (GGDEF)-like protein